VGGNYSLTNAAFSVFVKMMPNNPSAWRGRVYLLQSEIHTNFGIISWAKVDLGKADLNEAEKKGLILALSDCTINLLKVSANTAPEELKKADAVVGATCYNSSGVPIKQLRLYDRALIYNLRRLPGLPKNPAVPAPASPRNPAK
jgi:hypothetical protein